MNVYNYDENFDLELFKIGKRDRIENDKENWRLEEYKSGKNKYYRFAKGSRTGKITSYIGNRERTLALYSDRLGQRKPGSLRF